MLDNISKSKIFLYCLLLFIFGIAIASFLPNKFLEQDLYFFIGLVGLLVIIILFWKNKKIRLVALFGAILFLSFWRYSIDLNTNTPDKIWYYNGQTVTVEGIVSSEPDIRQNNIKLEVSSASLLPIRQASSTGSFENKDVGGKVLITTDLYPQYNYGDRLEARCELQAPEEFQGFAYDRYLARFDIYSVCYYPLLRSAERNYEVQARSIKEKIYLAIFQLKDEFRNIINYGLNEPEAGLARAIILGDKRGVNSDLRDIFSKVGISHVVAISGMHISILSACAMYLFLGVGLSRKHSFYLASIFLIFYIFLIGAPSSAVRAGMMGFLVLLALNIGRLSQATNSLFFVASFLLFQISF